MWTLAGVCQIEDDAATTSFCLPLLFEYYDCAMYYSILSYFPCIIQNCVMML